MKREVIERLAMDSAAGELNEDILALFNAYLAEHPQAGRWAEDMAGIYRETEAAINEKTGDADFSGAVPVTKIKPLVRVKWWAIGRAAAALIVAALIGFAGGRWTINGEADKIAFVKPERPAVQVKTISDLKEQYAGTFWGKKVLALVEHTSSEQYRAGFRDTSFRQIYRQYIKEKPDE
jgi:hypothetical protein